MVQDIIQFTRLADIAPTKRGNLPLLFSAGLNGFVMFYWQVSTHKRGLRMDTIYILSIV